MDQKSAPTESRAIRIITWVAAGVGGIAIYLMGVMNGRATQGWREVLPLWPTAMVCLAVSIILLALVVATSKILNEIADSGDKADTQLEDLLAGQEAAAARHQDLKKSIQDAVEVGQQIRGHWVDGLTRDERRGSP